MVGKSESFSSANTGGKFYEIQAQGKQELIFFRVTTNKNL